MQKMNESMSVDKHMHITDLETDNICNTLAGKRNAPYMCDGNSWYVTEIWYKQCKYYAPPSATHIQ